MSRYLFILLFAPGLAATNIDYDRQYEDYWQLYSRAIEQVGSESGLFGDGNVSVSSLLQAADPSMEIIAKSITEELEANSPRSNLMERFHNDSAESSTALDYKMRREILPHLRNYQSADGFHDVASAIYQLDKMLSESTGKYRYARLWEVDNYDKDCKSIGSEHSTAILQSLERLYVEWCPISTASSVEQQAAMLNALIRAEAGIQKVDPDYAYNDLYANAAFVLRTWLHDISRDDAQRVARQLQHARGLSRGDLAELVNSFSSMTNKRKDCRLASIFNASDNRRKTLLAVIAQLELTLLRLTRHVQPCAWRLKWVDNRDTRRREYVTSVQTRIEHLLNHSRTWASETLRLQWPSSIDTAIGVLASQFRRGSIGRDDYDKAARIIKRELDIRGPQTMEHQVLVTGFMFNEINYWAHSAPGYEADYQMRRDDDLGIFVHVVRFNNISSDAHALEGTRVFSERREHIRQFITDFHLPGPGSDAKGFLAALQQAQHLVDAASFRHAIVLQRDGYSDYDIVVGQAISNRIGSEQLRYCMMEEVYTPRFLRRDYTTRVYVFA